MAVIFFVKFVASFSSWLCVTDYPILASLVPNATMQSMPPLVCKTENLAERIRFQQQEVDLLKKEIFGTDKIPRSAYIRRFLSEFAEVQALVSYEDLIEAARKSRIIYVGDYHASKKYQQFQARLLEDLAREPILLTRGLWMTGQQDESPRTSSYDAPVTNWSGVMSGTAIEAFSSLPANKGFPYSASTAPRATTCVTSASETRPSRPR